MTIAYATSPTTRVAHSEPPWCDPAVCEADAPLIDGGEHVYVGDPIELSLYDRTSVSRLDMDYVQQVNVFASQHVAAVAPTLGLYSESLCSGGGAESGFEVWMTREEYVALHAAMGRLIEATR
jgi:hypothetical protein